MAYGSLQSRSIIYRYAICAILSLYTTHSNAQYFREGLTLSRRTIIATNSTASEIDFDYRCMPEYRPTFLFIPLKLSFPGDNLHRVFPRRATCNAGRHSERSLSKVRSRRRRFILSKRKQIHCATSRERARVRYRDDNTATRPQRYKRALLPSKKRESFKVYKRGQAKTKSADLAGSRRCRLQSNCRGS